MSNNNSVPDALRGLAALASRDDLDVYPVLLRVTTDLFVMKDHHAPDEIRQFEEIVLNMLDDVDAETRAVVAGKLASYCAAPAAIIERLIAYGGGAAAAILEKSNTIGHRACTRAACFGDTELATAIARRADLDAGLVRILAQRAEPEVLVALARNSSATISRATFLSLVRRARSDAVLAGALLARAENPDAEDPDDLAPLFLAASSEVRLAIILAARRHALGQPPHSPASSDASLLEELEQLAFASDRRPFAAALAAATGARLEDMEKAVADPGGEPLALVLAALGMTPEAATRIFLTSDPVIAHSYKRVALLRQLVGDIGVPVAHHLISRFLDGVRRPLRYAAATDPTAAATPSRSSPVVLATPTRGATAGDPRSRRPIERLRR